MDWQHVATSEHANAIMQRLTADDARINELECHQAARDASDADSSAIWTMFAIKHHVTAMSNIAAANISDEIAAFAAEHQPR